MEQLSINHLSNSTAVDTILSDLVSTHITMSLAKETYHIPKERTSQHSSDGHRR